MPGARIAITLERETLRRLDRLVSERRVPSRGRAIQMAVEDYLDRLEHGGLARECARLDREREQALADEGLSATLQRWPGY